jgi:ABC-type transport system involved in cytochrome c biogenesis permease subunit
MSESILVWGGTASYGASAISILWPTRRESVHKNLSFCLLAVGVVLLAIAIIERWVRIGQGPFMTMYEVLLSNAFSVGLIYALVFFFIPLARVGAKLILPFLFVLAAWAVTVPSDSVPLPATFDNYWLWFHVLAGKLFLGLCLTAVGLSVMLLLNQFNIGVNDARVATRVASIDGLIWRFIAAAFVFHSLMLVAGSVWAYDAWGRYWAWDPLETWALITWLALAITLHIRITFNVPQWTGWLMILVVFVLAFLTFFGMPFLNMAPHKGIM